MAATRTALVIGAGIAGTSTALALQRAGITATVHEARPAGGDDTGVFLTLASNGIHALGLLDAADAVLATGFATPRIVLRSGTGRYLGAAATGLVPPDGTTSHTLRRADLARTLADTARARDIPIQHGRRLVAAHDTGNGVLAEFDDGSQQHADLLIGCDGVHSVTRRIIDPAAPAPRYTGLVGTGGHATAVPTGAAAGDYEMIFGRRAFFGHVTTPDDQVWWFANLPQRPEPTRSDLRASTGQQRRDQLLALFADDAGPATALLRAGTDPEPFSPTHTVPHLPHWHRGPMIVIGDAAHAPSPSSGQGASLAVEDAVVLAGCLRDHPDPATAFARFEAARRPRVEQIIRRAERVNSSKAAGPVGRRIRDAVMPAILRMTADSAAVRRIHDHHIDWEERPRASV